MMIALNALSAQGGGGISMFISLLPHLARFDTVNEYIVFYSPRQQGVAEAIPASFRRVAITYLPRNPFVRVLWEQTVFPCYLLWCRARVLYSVGNTTTLLAPCTVILLIENANPYSRITFPYALRERVRNRLLAFLGRLSAARATCVRFVSNNSRELILGQIRVTSVKCVTIPHGHSLERLAQASRTAVRQHPRSYILAVGTNAPHRNIPRLLDAFAMLIRQYEYSGDLVILGGIGSLHYGDAIRQTIARHDLAARVMLTGEVPHKDVASYYVFAEALAFASLEETFGLPLIEAMGFGVPIVAADCNLEPAYRGRCFNPFREICNNAAHYVNPFDVADIAVGLHRVVSDTAYRTLLIERGRARVTRYAVENTAIALTQLFTEVAR